MRRLLTVVLSVVVVFPFLTGTAQAATCTALAGPPLYDLHGHIHATGQFGCGEPRAGMTLTVCIESSSGAIEEPTWWQLGCATTTAEQDTDVVKGQVVIDVPIYATLLRTTVSGTNTAGETADATSVPTPWFNCACMII